MTRSALESFYFRHKFGPGNVGFPDMIPRYHHPGPIRVTSFHKDQTWPERKLPEADGSGRKQTNADGSRGMASASLESVDFIRKFGPWHVGFPDMLPRHHHHGPQSYCHQPHGPEATRNGFRRKMAEADGSRRKLTEAKKWQKQR